MPAYGTFKYGEGKYGGGWQLPFSETIGSYRGHKFTMIMNTDGQIQVHNKAVDASETIYLRYLERGAILRFDPAVDHIFIFTPLINDLQASDESNMYIANADTAEDFFQLKGADFYDGKNLQWNMGMIPFDVSLLNSTSWSDQVLSGSEFGTITINNYPAGSYRAFVYMMSSTGDEEADYEIIGALGTSGINSTGAIPPGGVYFYVDFIADELDDITYKVTRTGGTNPIVLGDLIIFPLANSKNFPFDVIDQSLMVIKITEIGG